MVVTLIEACFTEIHGVVQSYVWKCPYMSHVVPYLG